MYVEVKRESFVTVKGVVVLKVIVVDERTPIINELIKLSVVIPNGPEFIDFYHPVKSTCTISKKSCILQEGDYYLPKMRYDRI